MKKKEIIGNIVWFIGLFIVLLVVKKFIFTPVTVSGQSMEPSLADRERAFAVRNSTIQRFDIVTFPSPFNPKESYVKRVIGLPGDKVSFEDDVLLINDEPVAEPYLATKKAELVEGDFLTKVKDQEGQEHSVFSLSNLFDTETVPAGEVFVLGDNRQNSSDSRHIGFVKEKDITSELKVAFWPPSKFGKVK